MKYLVITKGTELLRVPVERLMYVSSDGNYSYVVTLDGRSRLVSYQLGQIEELLREQLSESDMHFVRLGRGLIINTNYIYFIDTARQQLILSDCFGNFHELSASHAALNTLKIWIESQMQ